MKPSNDKKRCRPVRDQLASAVGDAGGQMAGWLGRHVAGCPKCQRRMQGLAKVDLAFSLLKAQPHPLDLVMRANNKAVAMLKRPVRQTTQAQAIRYMLPKPTLSQKLRKYCQPVASAAACLLAVVLLRAGLNSSIDRFRQDSEQAFRQYYARHLDQETLDDLL